MERQRILTARPLLGLLVGGFTFALVLPALAVALETTGKKIEVPIEVAAPISAPSTPTATEMDKLLGIDPWSYARVLGLPEPILPPVPPTGAAGQAEIRGPAHPAFGAEKTSFHTIVVGPDGLTALEAEKAAQGAAPSQEPSGTAGGVR